MPLARPTAILSAATATAAVLAFVACNAATDGGTLNGDPGACAGAGAADSGGGNGGNDGGGIGRGLNWANDGSPGPQDNPFFIQKMNEFFRANAGTGPGQILYEVYYNIGDVKAQLYPVASNPDGSAKYKSLAWGK